MKYKLKVYSIWEFGQRKDSQGNPHQEDSMFPQYGKQSADDRLFILCDGMGGHDAGEVASATVCEAMSESVLNDGHDKEGVFTAEDFSKAINAAFEALDRKDSGAEKKMGTTMTFLKLYDRGAFIAHMGDSRVYQIRPGKTGAETKIVFQTEDHSLVNDLIKIGELTKEEARYSKQKNVITRAMQPNMDRRPKADVYETSDIKGGDYFYMCSDGMLEQAEMENGESLKNIFSEMGGSDENKVEILKSVTEKNRDNHTAFIIHILEVENPTEQPIADKTSAPAADDKFTAIVEDGPKSAETESKKATRVVAKTTTEKTTEKTAIKKSSYSSIVKFIGAAMVVLAIVIGLNCFRSCSEEKDNTDKEPIERHDIKPAPTKKPAKGKLPKKEKETTSGAASTTPSAPPTVPTTPSVPSTQTAVEAANSAAANQLEASTPQNQTSGNVSIPLPPKKGHPEDVVGSDEQSIQNLIQI